MIILHHLSYSRSLRIIWLLEELAVPYELVSYSRTSEFRAPPELAKFHPLGKAPIMLDGDIVLSESSTILRYLNSRYGNGTLSPSENDIKANFLHEELLDFVESSAALPIAIEVIGKLTGGLSEKMSSLIKVEVAKTLDYIEMQIGDRKFLAGNQLRLADIQLSYLLSLIEIIGELDNRPVLISYYGRLKAQPGFQRAAQIGGPLSPGSFD